MDKKAFALAQIAPYFADRSTVAFNYRTGECAYWLDDGLMCVAGKNLIDPVHYSAANYSITEILAHHGQEALRKESRNILDPKEWQGLQRIHDCMAPTYTQIERPNSYFTIAIESLNLFTYEELVAETIPLLNNRKWTDKEKLNAITSLIDENPDDIFLQAIGASNETIERNIKTIVNHI